MTDGLTRRDDNDGLGGDSGAVGTSATDRPRCRCHDQPMAPNGRKWLCAVKRAEGRARRTEAQARYRDTEKGAYKATLHRLRRRIRVTERRIAEVQAEITPPR